MTFTTASCAPFRASVLFEATNQVHCNQHFNPLLVVTVLVVLICCLLLLLGSLPFLLVEG